MDWNKYIIIKIGEQIQLPILFHGLIKHDSFLKSFSKDRIISAGFFQTTPTLTKEDRKIEVQCFGKSITLNLRPRPEDAEIIKRMLNN